MLGHAHSSPIVSGVMLLEGGDETLQALCVDPAGAGPHQLDGQRVDARQAGELVRGDSRQPLEIRRRQVVLDVAGRGRDDVEIVEQPFGRRRDGLALVSPASWV